MRHRVLAAGSAALLAGMLGLAGGAARAQTAQAGKVEASNLTSRAAAAQIRGDPQEALRLADQALTADGSNAWAHFNRATALSRLGQTDAAVEGFRTAERTFGTADTWGRSV